MEDYGISANMFSNLILMNTQYVSAIYGELMEAFGVFFRAIVTLYIVYTGYKYFNAESKVAVWDLTISCIVASGIYGVVFEWNWFYGTVIETAVNLTLDASSFFISAAPSSGGHEGFGNVHEVFKSLDQTVVDFFNAVQELSPKGNLVTNAWRHVCFLLAMAPLFILFMAMYSAFFVIFGVAFFSMFIFFILGGPCFLFMAFKETRHVFFHLVQGPSQLHAARDLCRHYHGNLRQGHRRSCFGFRRAIGNRVRHRLGFISKDSDMVCILLGHDPESSGLCRPYDRHNGGVHYRHCGWPFCGHIGPGWWLVCGQQEGWRVSWTICHERREVGSRQNQLGNECP